ncbi:MAG: TIGR00341 family protein [Firmicutes bacterium]|nr:TIGR00341 family protein [Bacillota bacterium]MCM1401060.1 TIGR00341 family protein [Bacteroides sp.]MCM1476979.1 TIGR00341 family protein [Bacteroides sp.]
MPLSSNKFINFFSDYFNLSPQLLPQAEGEQAIRDGVSFKGTNIIILVLAILIASLGLNTNSTAVIIGAMLISPLMGPIIGIGLGVGVCDFELIKRALRNLVMAAGFSIAASTLYFLISPVSESHSELLARTSPTIYDVLIGFVGGFAGILAIGSSSKGNVIPGVAIATALMPPLCTAGYGLATWQLNYLFGAGYLFIINSIYIAFATFIGVKLLKYKPVAATNSERARKVRRIVYTVAILTMLPSVWLTWRMLTQTKFAMRASKFVATECVFPDTQVLSDKAAIIDGKPTLTITLIGQPLSTDSLKLALTSRMSEYGLKDTHLVILQGSNVIHNNTISTANMRDFYEVAQTTIVTQQQKLDSLRQVIRNQRDMADLGSAIAPEIKVLFPQIADIAISRSIFTSMADSARQDTLNLALVNFASPMSRTQIDKLDEYLRARLNLSSVEIVNTGHIINHPNKK